MNYTDKEVENLLKLIYVGIVKTDNLPEDLYFAIAEHLENGLYKGYGANLSDLKLGTPDYELLNTLRENVYIFSGAKTYQQVREMGAMVADSATFTDFKKKVYPIYDEYNKNWLQSEYNTARGQAQQANQWIDIQKTKNLFPYLEYTAVIDTRTSEICRPLDGIVLPVDDPLWNKYTPLNHFNCRCTLRKIDKYTDVTITDKTKVASITKELDETVQPAFKMNAGKDGYIFDPSKHPYFEVAPKDKALAKQNFNLPIPPPPITQTKAPHKFALPKIKELGVELDERIYDMLDSPIKMVEAKGGAYAVGNEIHIDWTKSRWIKSDVYKKEVLYHEIAHISHNQLGIINTRTGIVSDEYKKHFNELKKLVKGKGDEINNKLISLSRKINYGTPEEKLQLIKKYGVKNDADLEELIGSTADSLMALTNSKYGWGHTKQYMSVKAKKEAEMYAHSAENFFNGNSVFKDLMPEVYLKSASFIENKLNNLTKMRKAFGN